MFAKPDKPLGQTDLAAYKVDTGNHNAIKLPARRTPLAKKEVIDKELDKMVTAGFIQPSSSPWSAPVCIVSKKDGTPRFRKINSITTKDAYPLPKLDDAFNALAGSWWYHIVDIQTGY